MPLPYIRPFKHPIGTLWIILSHHPTPFRHHVYNTICLSLQTQSKCVHKCGDIYTSMLPNFNMKLTKVQHRQQSFNSPCPLQSMLGILGPNVSLETGWLEVRLRMLPTLYMGWEGLTSPRGRSRWSWLLNAVTSNGLDEGDVCRLQGDNRPR